jgi:hypothetical protein
MEVSYFSKKKKKKKKRVWGNYGSSIFFIDDNFSFKLSTAIMSLKTTKN